MVLDYIQVVLSSFVFLLYLWSIFLLFNVRGKLKGNSRIAFTFFIISIFVIALRRVQQTFIDSDILFPIPYSADIIALLFSLFFFLGTIYLYKSIKSSGKSSGKKSAAGILREYKKRFK